MFASIFNCIGIDAPTLKNLLNDIGASGSTVIIVFHDSNIAKSIKPITAFLTNYEL